MECSTLWLTALVVRLLPIPAALAGEPAILVHLFDEVNLDPKHLEAYKAQAREILSRAGVDSTWLDCPARTSPETPAGCLGELTGAAVVIRLLPRTMIGDADALGSSVANRDGGVYALVFYPKVEEAAQILNIRVPVMLALATVHEIGHLILGSRAHWPAGIMHRRWGAREVEEMTRRSIFFNEPQARQFRAMLMARVRSPQ